MGNKGANDRVPSKVLAEQLSHFKNSEPATVLNYWNGGLILANISLAGMPELIIQIKDLVIACAIRQPSSLQISGLEIWYQALTFNDTEVSTMVVRPRYHEGVELFYKLADHLVESLVEDETLDIAPASVESVIADWMNFWKREKLDVNRELLLGLLGELVAIDRVLDLDGVEYSIWEGPNGSPKDFRGKNDALEVKVSGTRTGPLIHRISSIHQLQVPDSGRLFVLSLRVEMSATGRESYSELVSRVGGHPMFQSSEAKSHFSDALAQAGYHKGLPINLSRFDIIEQSIYEVTDGFPRLTKDLVPEDPRVLDITYSVDFSSTAEYLHDLLGQKLKLN